MLISGICIYLKRMSMWIQIAMINMICFMVEGSFIQRSKSNNNPFYMIQKDGISIITKQMIHNCLSKSQHTSSPTWRYTPKKSIWNC